VDTKKISFDGWVLDPNSGDLERAGVRIRLQEQPLQLLLELIASSGAVVTREQLIAKLWPKGIVDFDTGLNTAIRKLRGALGDIADTPRYIETLPRRGYRFIAAVDPDPGLLASPPPEPSSSPVATPSMAVAAPEPIAAVAPAEPSRRVLVPAIAVLVVVLAAGSLWWWLSRSHGEPVAAEVAASAAHGAKSAVAPVPDKSIAVLPFVDLSEKKDQEYFSDGLSEELIDLLTKVPDLRVPARTSSFYFKGQHATIAQIARALSVAHVLEGSVRRDGNTIRVTAQLVRADNGYHLWSESYDRELKDIFQVQDEIAGAVVTALKLKLAPGQLALNSHRTSSTEAYNQYLLGRQFDDRPDLEGFRHAVGAYRKAIQLDPNYAAAYAGLAIAQSYVADQIGDAAGWQQAAAAADKAVILAPDDAYGYAARGFLRSIASWDWSGAQADFEKALALDPSDSTLQRRYGGLLASLGRLPEAIAATHRAIELDPLSSSAWQNLTNYLMANRQFAAAHEANRRALEIQPESIYALNDLGTLQLLEGNRVEALATFHRVGVEGLSLSGIAMAEHALGHAQESQQARDKLVAKDAQDAAYQIAEVCAWRGEKDAAFDWLERAYKQHDGGLSDIKNDLLLAPLHGDPRFAAMLTKMRLPK
jgi:TolB-like protein/DNA-binding winged helix-turn-helix (wHTH) protein/Tfp pilus assembly protein PilF